MKKFLVFFLVLILTASSANIFASGFDALPAPDWIEITNTPDASKTVTITTPTYMIDKVDYYEYSTDFFNTVNKISNNNGGELVFESSVTFSLRYCSGGFMSETYTADIVVTKVNVVTNQSTGISLLIPFNSALPSDLTLSGFEITGGNDFATAAEFFGEDKAFRLFNIAVMKDNAEYESKIPYTFLFPCDDLSVGTCEIYAMNENGKISLLKSTADMNTRTLSTSHTGLFIIAGEKTYSTGDLNGDGLIQATDARMALRISARLDTADDKQNISGDVNKNGKIDAADARLILRVAASLDKFD